MNVEQIEQLVAELKNQLAGSRVAKIHQPAADMLLFRLWTGQQNLKLQIVMSSQNSFIQLTDENHPNPFQPPRFCQLLRARVARIVDIHQLNEDRIVEFQCQGAKGDCRLIAELTGRSSNLIFVDEHGKVVDFLLRQKDGRLQLGEEYVLPEKKEGQATHKPAKTAEKGSSEKDLKSQLLKLLAKERKKLSKRLSRIEQEYSDQQDFERYQQLGNLLLANLHQIHRGMPNVAVMNYYSDPAVEESIPLDPELSPQENADKYFHRYKKYRRGIEHSERRLAETRDEQEWLEDLSYQLETAEQTNDLAVVAELLKKSGLLKEKASRLPRSGSQQLPAKEALSPGGFKVIWGSNSRQNDMISTKLLRKGDLWFHAHRCPGSHVLLKGEGGKPEFSGADIEFAASIAAANCKAKNDGKVEVMVAEAKAVKKPSGAKPGMVTVQQYKTLVVKPIDMPSEVF